MLDKLHWNGMPVVYRFATTQRGGLPLSLSLVARMLVATRRDEAQWLSPWGQMVDWFRQLRGYPSCKEALGRLYDLLAASEPHTDHIAGCLRRLQRLLKGVSEQDCRRFEVQVKVSYTEEWCFAIQVDQCELLCTPKLSLMPSLELFSSAMSLRLYLQCLRLMEAQEEWQQQMLQNQVMATAETKLSTEATAWHAIGLADDCGKGVAPPLPMTENSTSGFSAVGSDTALFIADSPPGEDPPDWVPVGWTLWGNPSIVRSGGPSNKGAALLQSLADILTKNPAANGWAYEEKCLFHCARHFSRQLESQIMTAYRQNLEAIHNEPSAQVQVRCQALQITLRQYRFLEEMAFQMALDSLPDTDLTRASRQKVWELLLHPERQFY